MIRIPDRDRLDAPSRLRRAVLALGSNLGDRGELLRDAVAALRATPAIEVRAVSPVVESVAVKPGGADPSAPRYLNAVVLVDTLLDPEQLLAEAHRIEAEHGRVRAERWGDRTLDIDIVDFAGVSSNDPALTLPHPRAAERPFVLAPWLFVDPDAALPGAGRVDALLAALGDDTVTVEGVAL
ncbi:2-amino-4-hydroxy-6-hydroxymethyldihydropteridine diphosphokinase [Gryllotalpicola protaetiae]|uniref:2-amino-4-hydroxy-6-hydroxymethyldihydropteridine diphosphokinase n=1 Tax=Gryllotalpicola protaetiae TaxID=2419771 RepID=A0A387BQ15_9MICO|nr:2-amino-4-hydroxy-6-hydroxymethyldihydropteridine diphosphokinase [Gryllotalpicola protaetiae]AYG03120.1 2-amino-4-hydroxy-6-hydroxymethyldihydropteridine diphosphokinase [Gryllotalpicola protaetiae]